MEKRLIAIDLDGTLLRKDCTISEKDRNALLKAMERGHLVVPTTGRGYRNSRFVLKEFPVMPYYINANGTTITQGDPEKILFSCTMPYEIGCKIYQLAKEYPTFIEIYHGQDAYDSFRGCEYMKESRCMEAYRKQLLKTNIHMESLDDFVLKEKNLISKFHIMCVEKKDQQELIGRIAQLPGVYPISTEEKNIEIADAHWSKRNGLEWLCEKLGFARDQVIAIGDSDNDYEGIRWAGIGVAMENASERVKEAADYITESNQNYGVARALEHYGLTS